MAASTHELSFTGDFLRRGFWLYVWEITPPKGKTLYYVGRTGDSSSANAQSPFNRMGQHLGSNDRNNVLRGHLEGGGLVPEECTFRLVAHGPVQEEAEAPNEHRTRRDTTAALEKALAEAMDKAGYTVINAVHCRKSLDAELSAGVRAAFGERFPRLRHCAATVEGSP